MTPQRLGMKKLLGILVLSFTLLSSQAKSGSIGMGEVTLHPETANEFVQYIKGKNQKKPMVFYITTDGVYSCSWYCPEAHCEPGGHSSRIKMCEDFYDREVKLFASRRTIKWKNEFNKGGKVKINSKWSATEIKAKLKEFGFLE